MVRCNLAILCLIGFLNIIASMRVRIKQSRRLINQSDGDMGRFDAEGGDPSLSREGGNADLNGRLAQLAARNEDAGEKRGELVNARETKPIKSGVVLEGGARESEKVEQLGDEPQSRGINEDRRHIGIPDPGSTIGRDYRIGNDRRTGLGKFWLISGLGKRWLIDAAMLPVLEDAFSLSKYPSIATVNRLVEELGVSTPQVKVWFAKRRQRAAAAWATRYASASTIGNDRRRGDGKRWRIDAAMLKVLEEAFSCSECPSSETCNRLATELGTSKFQIELWFQNRRQLRPDLPEEEEPMRLRSRSSVQTLPISAIVNSEVEEPTRSRSKRCVKSLPASLIATNDRRRRGLEDKRWRIDAFASAVLEEAFSISEVLSDETRDRLAAELGASTSQIKMWFQESRKLAKKRKLDPVGPGRRHAPLVRDDSIDQQTNEDARMIDRPTTVPGSVGFAGLYQTGVLAPRSTPNQDMLAEFDHHKETETDLLLRINPGYASHELRNLQLPVDEQMAGEGWTWFSMDEVERAWTSWTELQNHTSGALESGALESDLETE